MTAAPSEGQVIAGRYELQAMIGEGGMARVWRAHDRTLARPVAVKFLFLREDRDRRTMIDRFLREARIAAAVRHPSVVDILDFGTTEDGRPFMVMELLEGESLEERLAREPALTLEELIAITASVLDGLAAVHRAGIIHRDLKPDNVFLLQHDGEVRPKLLDFGVSRDTDPRSGRRSALTTADGYLVGTPEYMSPEQARGLADVDWRTDLYSVGVMLYEALTGRLPYESEAVGDLIILIAAGGAKEVRELRPEVGEAISGVVARAMSSRREDRHQSAREMRDALLAAAEECLGVDVRKSLPAVAPVRRVSPARARRYEPPSSLDGQDLAWGASAVPILGGEPERVEPERAWTVDTTLPRARKPWGVLLAAVAIPLAGIGTWYALRAPAQPSTATRSTPVEVEAPTAERTAPQTAPTEPREEREVVIAAAPELGPPLAPHVRVRLRDLPPDARVRVDGEAVELEDGALTLPRDGERHSIVVTAPGLRPWRATHTADGDGNYRVRARPARAERRSQPGPAAGEVFRELDY